MTTTIAGSERAELIARLREMAPHADQWRTRLTKSAFAKGFSAGVAGEDFGVNPYRQKHQPNFARGGNDPRSAWDEGYIDGERVLRMLVGVRVSGMRMREILALPSDLQRVHARFSLAAVEPTR